jgi:hypothetical protein
MRRIHWYSLLMLMLVAGPSSAIQLRWSTGTTDLTFTSATRCTLIVQADATQQQLPGNWGLLWVTDGCDIRPLALDARAACEADIAQVAGVEAPTLPADMAGNVTTAHFCSAGGVGPAAQYVFDLPAAARGRLKVVAIDPADPDSSRIIQSPEATFNGGVPNPFPPAILRAVTVHRSTEFRLKAVGAGLAATRAPTLAAPDGSWQVPLSIGSQGDSAITATAPLAANVPSCVIQVGAQDGGVAVASVPADPPPPPLQPAGSSAACFRLYEEAYEGHDPNLILPRDFAFIPGGWTPSGAWTFHLLYGRLNQYLAGPNTEKNFGHVVSNDLANWQFPRSAAADTAAFSTHPGGFDSFHVWAPSVVRKGLTYYMFYTGVDDNNVQRIGLTTSTDLLGWTQGSSVLDAAVLAQQQNPPPWVDPAPGPPYGGKAQLRDPFVMEDPAAPGDWLMYFATVASAYTPEMVVGVARSHGNFESWEESFPLWNTHHSWLNPTNHGGPYVVESPHAFQRDGKWWLLSTVNNDSVWAASNSSSPIDTLSAGLGWTPAEKLSSLVPVDQGNVANYFHASEYLQISAINDIEFLAGWNDAQPGILYTQMKPPPPHDPPLLFSMDCPSAAGVGEGDRLVTSPRLLLTGLRPARGWVGMRIELPGRMRAHLAVYDILGRRMRTLLDGDIPAGTTELSWDGRDQTGARVGSGIYFASLTTEGIRRSVRVPLIR